MENRIFYYRSGSPAYELHRRMQHSYVFLVDLIAKHSAVPMRVQAKRHRSSWRVTLDPRSEGVAFRVLARTRADGSDSSGSSELSYRIKKKGLDGLFSTIRGSKRTAS